MKIFECKICKDLSKKIKGEKRFRGSRSDVRKHLRLLHRVTGTRTMKKREVSATGLNTLSEEF